jgi:cytosine/adenosine deaminase-related metal-dependent hydrolase
MRRVLLFIALACFAQAESYRFGRIWDGEKLWTNAVIVVEGDKIKSVGMSGGPAVDMTRYTALPGLIDVHTHMTYVLDMNGITASGRGGATVWMSQENIRKTLEAIRKSHIARSSSFDRKCLTDASRKERNLPCTRSTRA